MMIFMAALCVLPVRALPAPPVKKIAITIDLCPSSKRYDRGLFRYIDKIGKEINQPVPVAISVSGTWLLRHRAELAAIRTLKLAITWVNHSYSHPVAGDFLNNPKVDFKSEVQKNIELMKACGLVPSKYFRFPGLRTNPKNLRILKAMGYTPLSADAWLSKGQKIKDGSVVLVHGNGNDPLGGRMLVAYLKSRDRDLRSGRLRLMSVDAIFPRR